MVDSLLVFVAAIVIVIILVVVIFLLFKRKRTVPTFVFQENGGPGQCIATSGDKLQLPSMRHLSPLKEAGKPSVSAQAVIDQPPVNDIELTVGRRDITSSLLVLTEKYSLDQFTIATKDGLVFASSGSGTAQDDAAIYSGMYAHEPESSVPGIFLFTLDHKNSSLVCIVRTKKSFPQKILHQIEADTKDILNFWI